MAQPCRYSRVETHVKRRIILLLSLAGAALTALGDVAPARAADEQVAVVARPTPVDAFGGRVVWSAWDAAGQEFRLVEHIGGVTRALPVAASATPFDVDLGPGRRGGAVAVYSRCARPAGGVFGHDGRRGCNLYLYDFVRGRERALRRASSRADEYAPAVWRNRLAFARVRPARNGRAARRLLYWRRLTGPGRAHRLRRGAFAARNGGAPAELDIRGRRVAFRWDIDFGGELRVSTTTGRTRRVLLVPGSGAATIDFFARGITLSRGYVYWWLRSERGGDVRRYALAARLHERATTVLDPYATGFAQDGAAAYYVRLTASGQPPCAPPACDHDIRRLDGLAFEPAPPLVLK